MAAAVAGILALAGCSQGASPQADAKVQEAPAAQVVETVAANSFAAFLPGKWDCRAQNEFVEASVNFPELSNSYMPIDDIQLDVREDGTYSAVWDDAEFTAEGTWNIEGRTMTIGTPLGDQVIENVPETVDFAIEPVDVHMPAKAGDPESEAATTRIQVLGQRGLKITAKYDSTCIKS